MLPSRRLAVLLIVLSASQLATAVETVDPFAPGGMEKILKAKSENGDVEAQFQLGVMYVRGQGVTRDDVEAVRWYRKAAEQGHAGAQYLIGLAYYNGAGGVTKDDVEAVKWYRKAAEQGNVLAQTQLAGCYINGRGVTKDDVEAVKWFRKAAEQGEVAAQIQLAGCYFNGRGVTKDEAVSYKWYLLASAKGSEIAKSFVTNIEELLTPDQRAEGQRMAREFRPIEKLN